MERTFGKRKINVCCLLVLSYAFPFWANSQRALEKAEKIRANSVEQLFESAARWEGVREITGHNDHPMITRAMKLCGLRGDLGYAWCAACMADIHENANLTAPHSARVVDWFKYNVVWKREYGPLPAFNPAGMVGALYYQDLGRYGHIVLITGQDKHNYYTLEGNTNSWGSREGEGFYRKIRSKESIAALADYCVNGKFFIEMYDAYLQGAIK